MFVDAPVHTVRCHNGATAASRCARAALARLVAVAKSSVSIKRVWACVRVCVCARVRSTWLVLLFQLELEENLTLVVGGGDGLLHEVRLAEGAAASDGLPRSG